MSLLSLQGAGLLRANSEHLARFGGEVTSETARLSSGQRISRAADDIASLSISTALKRETTALSSSLRNLSQAASLLQVADAGLATIQDQLQRLNTLSTMAGSGSLSNAERARLDLEFQQLKEQINDTAAQTDFNGVQVLKGGAFSESVQDFSTPSQTIRSGDGHDRLTGTSGREVMISGSGNDTVRAGAGNDTIDAGSGMDSVDAGSGDDVITLDAANTNRLRDLPVRTGLVLHLDAARGVTANAQGEVTAIADRSGSGNNAFVDTNNAEIDASVMNGLASLSFDGSDVLQVADAGELNGAAQDERSIFLSFETGHDIATRQVLYEQGGGTNGFNIYIENERLYIGGWRGGGGNFEIFFSERIESNESYSAGMVFDFANSQSFSGFLNGNVIGSSVLTQTQAGHSGDIGIGGQNNASYFVGDGVDNADTAHFFSGEIGEILNYDRALSRSEAGSVSGYLLDKWRGAQDKIIGGDGFDRARLLGEAQSLKLSDSSGLKGVEYLDFAGNDTLHEIAVDDSYFAGGAVRDNTLYLDFSANDSAVKVDARGLSAEYKVIVLGSAGDDSIFGDGEAANVFLSYDHFEGGEGGAGGIRADLDFNELEAYGDDDATGVRGLIGSAGNDELIGGQNSTIIDGGAGDDIIRDIDITGGTFIAGNQILFLDSTDPAFVGTAGATVTTVTDKSGNGNNAFAHVGNVTYAVEEFNGLNAFAFDGNSSLRINDSPTINTSGQAERSFFATFRTGQDVDSQQFIYEEGGPVNGYSFYIRAGRVYIGAFTDTGATNDIYVSQPVEPNTAYVVGGVFNANTATLDLYINGTLFATEPVGGAQKSHPDNIGVGGINQNSRTDAGNFGTGSRFSGLIGEILLYDIALDQPQALALTNYLRALRFDGGDDIMNGGSGNDTITGSQGNDTIDGGSGNDTAMYDGVMAEYRIDRLDDGSIRIIDRIGGRNGVDMVRNVETLRFSDGDLGVDTSQKGGMRFAVNYNGRGTLDIVLPNLSADGLLDGSGVGIGTREAAAQAQEAVLAAIDTITALRAEMGAAQSSVDILSGATDSALQNQRAATGRLIDTDILSSSSSYAQSFLRFQVASTIGAQMNTLKGTVLLNILENGVNLSPLSNDSA